MSRLAARHFTALVAVALSVAMAFSCSSAVTSLPPAGGSVAIGTWGGDTAGFIVGDTAAHLHIGCTFGNVSGRIALDADGRFSAPGQYVLRAYPVAIGPALPAQFSGRVIGSSLTITVTVNDTVQRVTVVRGPVVVRFGATPQMANCPICSRPFDRNGSRMPLQLRTIAPRTLAANWTGQSAFRSSAAIALESDAMSYGFASTPLKISRASISSLLPSK